MFLCVTSAKGLKTDEKQQSSHNLQFQSSNFHKLANLVPGNLKHGKYHQRSFGIHKL
jgi:hypothetical protein